MGMLKVISRTNAEGELRLDVGVPNSPVHGTLFVEDGNERATDENARIEWEQFVRRTAGSITDPKFRRHPQGNFPKRGPLG